MCFITNFKIMSLIRLLQIKPISAIILAQEGARDKFDPTY